MINSKGALAIFVKTPGLSSVKTRLAASIGQEMATQFYKLSIKATEAVIKKLQKQLPQLNVYWAVAEQEALTHEMWNGFPVVFQGSGGLGERLDFVYKNLLVAPHSYVGFLGADSPHITFESIKKAIELTAEDKTKKFVMGKTEDGGFYFFAGSQSLPADVWLDVEYSTEKTAYQLEKGLRRYADIEFLEKNFDVDTLSDLKQLSFQSENLIQEQIELVQWAKLFK